MALLSLETKIEEPEVLPPSPKEPVPGAESGEPETQLAMFGGSQIEGDFDSDDLRIPFLSLAQKSGNLSDNFKPGDFVYDKRLDLGTEFDAVFLKVRKFYEEDLPYGGTTIPQRFDRKADVPKGMPVRDCADLILLIKNNELDGGLEVDGEKWQAARWVVRKTAYTTTVKSLMWDLNAWLKGKLVSGMYHVSRSQEAFQGNTYFKPHLKAAGATSKGLRKAIAEKFGIA